jgi:hypothetical protein
MEGIFLKTFFSGFIGKEEFEPKTEDFTFNEGVLRGNDTTEEEEDILDLEDNAFERGVFEFLGEETGVEVEVIEPNDFVLIGKVSAGTEEDLLFDILFLSFT